VFARIPPVKRNRILVVIVLAVLAIFALKVRHVAPAAPRTPPASAASQSAVSHQPSAIPGAPEASHLADALNSPQSDIRADLRIVSDVLDNFRTNFPHDGNPVGSNAEITAVLTGRNKLHLVLIPRDHPAINADGELCDRWGTPFFFHAESGTRMEIRSAGPDKKMWTADDVVQSP
jgi:hypothetical protein